MHSFNLDHSVQPHDDFFLHVNNIWINNNEIPNDKTSWNSFSELHEENYNKIKELLLSETNNPEFNKVLTLHKQAIAMQTLKPFIPVDMINNIMKCTTMEELRRSVIDQFSLYNIIQAHNFNVSSDMNNSNVNILHLFSGGLGLPDRDYYFNSNRANLLQEYKLFMQRYMDLFRDYTSFDVDNVFNVELFLAEHTYTSVQKRDATIMNNIYNLEDISVLCNELYNDISYFLSKINYPISNLPVNLTNPKFTLAYYKLLNNVDLETMKQYFIYLYLRKMGTYISQDAEEILFEFYGKTLSGMKAMQPVWKRAINVVESNLSMILGKMYVAKYFDETKKQKMLTLVSYIMDEFKHRLETNEWMTPETKERALEKLAKMNVKVGYPDKWIDYSELDITETNSYFHNILNCFRMDFLLEVKDIYNTVDKTKWFMSPYEINAYYSPEFNEIVFPAGILQEPFFGDDMAQNFGGIGCIVGHEITHGFDDMGRMFDADGNLRDWWHEEDSVKYKEKTNVLKEMYNNLTIEGERVNGELTLGENIADLGGVEISFSAMNKFFKNNDNTNQLKFFYSYANIWRYKMRKEEMIKRLTSDPHSPACFRVNTILSNVDAFYETFNLSSNCKLWLNKSERAHIW